MGGFHADGSRDSPFAARCKSDIAKAKTLQAAVNCEIVDRGVEGGTGAKVQLRVISPPRIYVDGNFASVTGTTALDTAQWHHVVHTYTGGVARIYVDGQLDASAKVTMNLPNPLRMWIGGWYDS